jgi:hypothetical protein
VKRVIKNRRTGFYLKEDSTWTPHWEQGLDFRGIIAVLSTKERLHLKEVDMVLIVGDTPSAKYDVVLPLEDGVTWGNDRKFLKA